MKFLVLFAGVVATTSAIPLESSYGQPAAPPLLIPQPIEQVTLPELPPVLEPGVVTFRQFHAQDELGGFSFGYQNLNSAKQEIRTPDGVTRGSYSYIDANGVPQKVEYIADPLNGFRVAATNLPVAPDAPIVDALAPLAASPVVVVDTPEVAAAKAEFQIAFEKAVARNAAAAEAGEFPEERPVAELRKKRSALGAGYGIPAAPVVQVPTPVVPVPAPQVARIVAPIAPVVPGPVRVAASPIPVPAPLPFAAAPVVQVTPRVASPVPIPAPVTPLTRALPLPSPLAAPLVRASPLPVGPIPAPLPVAPAPLPLAAAAPSSQFHAQDEAGGFSFGYQTLNSARQESRRPDGVTTGSYSYVDANGIPQTVNYIADALGFRVAGTNLPVAPVA